MAPTDLINAALLQTFDLWKNQCLQSAIKVKHNKQGMPTFFSFLCIQGWNNVTAFFCQDDQTLDRPWTALEEVAMT